MEKLEITGRLTGRRLLRIAENVVTKRRGLTLRGKELWAKVHEVEDRLAKRWYDSGCTDFGVYDDPDYLLTLLNSWSGPSMHETDRLCKDGFFDDVGTSLDFQGGIGLTSILMGHNLPGIRARTHCVVQEQLDVATEVIGLLGLTNVEVTSKLEPADLLIAQETFEHYRDPYAEVKRVFAEVRPKMYLDGTTFSIDAPGHFPEYRDGEVAVKRSPQAKSRLNKLLKAEGFTQWWVKRGLDTPFNSRPALWLRD